MLQDGSSRSCMLFTPFGYSDESFGGVATTRFPGRQRKRLCLEKELRVVKGFFVDGARVFKNLVEFFFFFFLHVGRKKTKRGFRGRIVIRCRFIHVSYYFSSLEEGLYYYYIPFQRE